MNEPEKRIVIMEVYGGCRNLRITHEGTYCAAYIHGGWEKIEPNEVYQYFGAPNESKFFKIAFCEIR